MSIVKKNQVFAIPKKQEEKIEIRIFSKLKGKVAKFKISFIVSVKIDKG